MNRALMLATVLAPSRTDMRRLLFNRGENGALFLPATANSAWQESTGVTPIAADSLLGLIYDQHLGITPQEERVTNGDFSSGVTTGWTGVNATLSIVDGRLRVTDAGAGAHVTQTISVEAGAFYRMSLKYLFQSTNTGTDYGVIIRATNIGGAVLYSKAAGWVEDAETDLSFVFKATTSTVYFQLSPSSTTNDTADFNLITARKIPGNHALQATAGSRPTYKAAPARIDFVSGTKSLSIAFASNLGADCTVAYAVAGVGATFLTGQTITTSYTLSIDNAGFIVVNRALTATETLYVTQYLNRLAGV